MEVGVSKRGVEEEDREGRRLRGKRRGREESISALDVKGRILSLEIRGKSGEGSGASWGWGLLRTWWQESEIGSCLVVVNQ